MNYEYIKALHIIFVVTWFAGLFYLPRLFVYHAEAALLEEPARSILKQQYSLMQRRLLYGIMWPSLVLTYVLGFWVWHIKFGVLFPEWFVLKLVFVLFLTLYHISLQYIHRRLEKGSGQFSSIQMRIWNEVPTVLLFAVVFIVILQGRGNWWYGLIGLGVLVILLTGGIALYRKIREKK